MNIETLFHFVYQLGSALLFFINEEKGKGTLTSAVITGGARPFRHFDSDVDFCLMSCERDPVG